MVDVSENRDHRRPRNEVFRSGFRLEGFHQVVLGGPLVDDLELDSELECQHLC